MKQILIKGALPGNNDMVLGNTAKVYQLFKQVDLVAATNFSVIIYGESGTGKEVMARAIHQRSARCNHPFVALDCGTILKELAGSELFGHVKGSFTGAINNKAGLFEIAHGGTLFLDEVGNLSIEIQASLLRVLQERKFKHVGGTKEIIADVRVLVASNENLPEACARGSFREDLFHRLNEFSITISPLRNRKKDIPLFAECFLAKASKELNKNVNGFDKEVIERFLEYNWPGNLREMMNVIRRMALLTKKNKTITTKMLPREFGDKHIVSAKFKKSRSVRKVTLKDAAHLAECKNILEVLKQVNYNKAKAADLLKIDRKTLYNKLKHYRMEKLIE